MRWNGRSPLTPAPWVKLAPMATLLAPLAKVEDAATQGKQIITAMLIVGLVFVGVIALGQTLRWLEHRRAERKARSVPY
jgi:hypothetical protein